MILFIRLFLCLSQGTSYNKHHVEKPINSGKLLKLMLFLNFSNEIDTRAICVSGLPSLNASAGHLSNRCPSHAQLLGHQNSSIDT